MSPQNGSPRRARVVCPCLKVTEAQVRQAVRRHGLTDLQGVTRCTQAGDGCTACHAELERILSEESPVDATCFRPSRSARRDSSPSPLP